MDFETYRIIFRIFAGIVGSTLYFIWKVLAPSGRGNGRAFAGSLDRDDDGGVRIFSFWNVSLICFLQTGAFLWLSGIEGSMVAHYMLKSFVFFMGPEALA